MSKHEMQRFGGTTRWRFDASHAALFLAGALAGALARWAFEPTPAPPTLHPRMQAARHTICADVREPHSNSSDDLRLRWCEARLAEKSREKPTMRRQWDSETPPEDEPGAWSDAINAALAACSPSMRAEITDCEEFPCVVALRPSSEDAPEHARDTLNACISQHFGESTWGAVGSLVVRAHCPDGTDEPVLLLTAMSKAGESVLEFPIDDFASIPDLYMLLGRRAESALQLWECRSQVMEDQ